MSGFAFGLLGSGEFEPWSADIDRTLLERAGGDGRVLILPAASAAEGDDVFEGWARMGQAHFDGLGIPAEVIPIKAREDADRPEFVEKLSDASMVYFSGGNPAFLSGLLKGTAFWQGLVDRLDDGLAYAGCSAGVACLGEIAPDSASMDVERIFSNAGLRLFPNTDFGPHWDALDSYVPGLRQMIIGRIPPGRRLIGIDEQTAIVGDGTSWSVVGSGGAHLYLDGSMTEFPSGSSFSEPLLDGSAA